MWIIWVSHIQSSLETENWTVVKALIRQNVNFAHGMTPGDINLYNWPHKLGGCISLKVPV